MARSIDTVELRGQVDKAVMDVLDACSIARGNPAVMDLAGIKQDECGV